MKLDDLKNMHIPTHSSIEIETITENFPPQIMKTVGYFNCIEEKPSARLLYYRLHYQELEGFRQEIAAESYESIHRIRKISVLAPKENQ